MLDRFRFLDQKSCMSNQVKSTLILNVVV
jgi:hypothetical protein